MTTYEKTVPSPLASTVSHSSEPQALQPGSQGKRSCPQPPHSG